MVKKANSGISTGAVVVIVVVVVIIIWLLSRGSCSRFQKGKFGNAEYQYSAPNKVRQWKYNRCLYHQCDGNTNNYDCVERCKLKVDRDRMMGPDIKDWVCWQYGPLGANNEAAFYRCLDGAYADWKYP